MRYTKYELPEIPYIPGQTKRPNEDVLQSEGIAVKSLSEVEPAQNEFFLYGVDLFNHHFFWEAHEAWESVWKSEERSAIRKLLQGLILLSGGFLKILQGNERGALMLWKKSSNRLSREIASETGICMEPLLKMLENEDTVCKLSVNNCFSPIELEGIAPLL